MSKLLKISGLSYHSMCDQLLAMSPGTSVCPNINCLLAFDLLTCRRWIFLLEDAEVIRFWFLP